MKSIKVLSKYAKNGFYHQLLLTIAAMGIAIVGLLFSITNIANADSVKSNNWTDLGTVPIVGSQDSQTVTAYACNKQVSSVLWKVEARFHLAYSYKTVNGFNWTASITNNSTDPIKNDESITKTFKDTVHPHVRLRIFTYPPVSSPLTFSYAAGSPSLGTTVSGNIAENVLPQDLATCN